MICRDNESPTSGQKTGAGGGRSVRMYNQKSRRGNPSSHLVGEDHEPWVENDRVQHMAADDDGEREDDGPVADRHLPINGEEWCAENDHAGDDDDRNDEGEPEAAEDLGHLKEEI